MSHSHSHITDHSFLRRVLPLALACAACGGVDGGPTGPVTLTQAMSSEVDRGFTCNNNTTKFVNELSFYRVFDLAEHEVFGTFKITNVVFGIFEATSGAMNGRQPARINVHSYTGEAGAPMLDLTRASQLSTTEIQISNSARAVLDIPVLVEVTGTVLVELQIPDGNPAMHLFSMGVNDAGELQPSYIRAPKCGNTAPTSLATIGFPMRSVVLAITGEEK